MNTFEAPAPELPLVLRGFYNCLPGSCGSIPPWL